MLTREARAALSGILVAGLLLMVVAIRLAGSGGSAAAGLAPVSTRMPRTFWVVQPGQTFGLLSRRTGLSVAQIEELNPNVDPGTLHAGQLIRLRAAHPKPPVGR